VIRADLNGAVIPDREACAALSPVE